MARSTIRNAASAFRAIQYLTVNKAEIAANMSGELDKACVPALRHGHRVPSFCAKPPCPLPMYVLRNTFVACHPSILGGTTP